MKRVNVKKVCAVALPIVALATAPVFAEVKTKDKSQFKLEGALGRVVGFFGGKAAKEGVIGSSAVKGNRKATLNETTGQIIDLSEEKVYDLDVKKKTYTVTTFEEIRRRMREEAEKAKQEVQKEEKEQPSETKEEKPKKEVEVDYDVKETGQKKQIAGYDTHEVVITVTVREKGKTLEDGGGMVTTTNEWLGPVIPELKELSDFDIRYAKALEGPEAVAAAQQLAAALAAYPMMKSALGRLEQEGSKLQGTPLETTTVFETVKSKEQMAQTQDQQQSSSGGIGGLLARKIAKKEPAKARNTVVTLHNEYLEVAKSVSPADVAVPPDFKEKK